MVTAGLETVHPEALARLNKRMTVDDFRRAAERLQEYSAALRVFVLLGLPFVPADPVRANPNIARAPIRRRLRASTGASVAMTIMIDPRSGCCFSSACPTGTPAMISEPPKFDCTSTPTV